MRTIKLLSILILVTGLFTSSFSQPSLSFQDPELDRFWISMSTPGDTVPGLNGGLSGVPDQPGEDLQWYFYENTGGSNPWYNIWFWNGPFLPPNNKLVLVGFYVTPLDPGSSGFLDVVVNWSSPEWSWPDPPPGPPLPPLTPDEEQLYVIRSETLFSGVIIPGEFTWVEFYYEIDMYNPGWVSIDVWGENFEIPFEQPPPPAGSDLEPFWLQLPPFGGLMVHECLEPDFNFEFGDAPDSCMAYLDGTIGLFPTCTNIPTTNFISHQCPSGIFLGGWVDCEADGNAGWCPFFNPNKYNMDECGTSPFPMPPTGIVDEGLMFPIPLTIVGPVGGESYTPCGTMTQPLDTACQQGVWGQNIDIWVDASQGTTCYLNVLFDWNQDGQWANDPNNMCHGNMVPEHVLVDFVIPGGYIGPLSGVVPPPPGFQIGPKEGYCWARFSLTEQPVNTTDWDGSGQFFDGETEDYLIYIESSGQQIPVSNWSVFLAIGLIVLFTAILVRRRM